jgi:3-dehydroquinate synthase
VPLVLVPTTLLAQVDAAIGGKNGINTETTKNLIGNFHHPTVVACDQEFLGSVPPRQIVSGIAECIKVFAVADGEALATHVPRLTALGAVDGRRVDDDLGPLEPWRDAVWDAVRCKLQLLEDDPYERSSKRLLNYGHAFAHLFEERSGYRLLHGEAVLLGMMVENEISAELLIARSEVLDLQDQIADLITPACRRWWVPFDDLGPELDRLRLMRRNALNLICLREPGDAVIVEDIADDVLRTAWEQVASRLEVASARRRDHAG